MRGRLVELVKIMNRFDKDKESEAKLKKLSEPETASHEVETMIVQCL